MQPTPSQHNDYLAHRPLPGVAFTHNSYVEVAWGEFAGLRGSTISVEVLGEDPVYLVELEAGRDALLSQSALKAVPMSRSDTELVPRGPGDQR